MTPLMHNCYHNNYKIVELLIRKKADLNKQTKIYYWTALMHGSYANSIESIELLLKNNARIDIRDSENKTAIDIARREEHSEIVKLINL